MELYVSKKLNCNTLLIVAENTVSNNLSVASWNFLVGSYSPGALEVIL